MAELVDALGSGPSGRKTVEVRVLFWAPIIRRRRRIVSAARMATSPQPASYACPSHEPRAARRLASGGSPGDERGCLLVRYQPPGQLQDGDGALAHDLHAGFGQRRRQDRAYLV